MDSTSHTPDPTSRNALERWMDRFTARFERGRVGRWMVNSRLGHWMFRHRSGRWITLIAFLFFLGKGLLWLAALLYVFLKYWKN